ncbi:hypothetical protein BDF22DRAFT_742314 [Syncephalis plumigaleata]|nr:hypothetical protein BDF22DRAFT_742314 [Syncephalis plumigaleata]
MSRRLHFVLAYALLLSGASITESAVLPNVYIQWSNVHLSSFSSRRLTLSTRRPSIEASFPTTFFYLPFTSQRDATIRESILPLLNKRSVRIKCNHPCNEHLSILSVYPSTVNSSSSSSSALTTRIIASTLLKDTQWLNANELPSFVYDSPLADSRVYCVDECGNYYASQDEGTTWTGPYHVSVPNAGNTNYPSSSSSHSMDATPLDHAGIGDAYQAEKDQCGQIWSSTDGGLTWSSPNH